MKALKYAPCARTLDRPQLGSERVREVARRPARDDGVVGEDRARRNDTQATKEAPLPARRRTLECGHGVRRAASPDGQFRDHQGYADQQDHRHVDDQEGGAAVLADDVGEPPDTAQSDRGTNGCEDEAELRLPLLLHSETYPTQCVPWNSPTLSINGGVTH